MRAVGLLLLIIAIPVVAEPFSLETVSPGKVPAKWKAPKDASSEVFAVIPSQRGDRIDCMAFHNDGKLLALSGPDQIVRIVDLEKFRTYAPMKQPQPVVSLAFSPDGKALAVGDSIGNIRLIGTEGGLYLKWTQLAHKDMPIWKVAFSPDGKRLYAAARDKAATVWDISKPKPVKLASINADDQEVRDLALSSDGELLATAGKTDKMLRLWNVSGDSPKAAGMVKLADRVVSVAIAPDAKSIAIGGAKGIPAIYTLSGDKLTKSATLETAGHAATSIGFSPEGSLIAGISGLSATEDRVLVWNAKGEVQHEFKYGLHLHGATFAPDGKHLAVITEIEVLIVRLPTKN